MTQKGVCNMTATLEVPATDERPPISETLPDTLALSYGTMFARTLSEDDGFVVVTLSDGKIRVIGYDTLTGQLTIGHLNKGV